MQEGGSMIPPLFLELGQDDYVLDVCAAPGSKTTQMAQIMENKGGIVANDISLKRITSLGHNLQLCGVLNTVVTMFDGRRMPLLVKDRFDKVLVDAPCSSSGHLLGKRPPRFTERRVRHLSMLQRSLILAGFKMLKSDGILVYSTCSIHPEENEVVVDFLLSKERDAVVEPFNVKGLKTRPGIVEWDGRRLHDSVEWCTRIYPHDNRTDGFFIARIRKEGSK